ncbi:hypothetical protein CEXT_790521 [Caerostris extrusa]|uniref:Uncharacterized protein n=1 Tax=Caerostris extrusa TaxID=172846 RepID=A0AAV4Y7C8_CAEEX|nr:hypothetical protein CEXT_790521 [Caerostris extrusa]
MEKNVESKSKSYNQMEEDIGKQKKKSCLQMEEDIATGRKSLTGKFVSAMGGSFVSLTPPAEFLKNPASNLTLLMNKASFTTGKRCCESTNYGRLLLI